MTPSRRISTDLDDLDSPTLYRRERRELRGFSIPCLRLATRCSCLISVSSVTFCKVVWWRLRHGRQIRLDLDAGRVLRNGWRLLLLSAGAACSRPEKQTQADAETVRASPAEKRYPLHGEIVAVNLPRKTLTVSHEAIPGLMPAMTMEFAAPTATWTSPSRGSGSGPNWWSDGDVPAGEDLARRPGVRQQRCGGGQRLAAGHRGPRPRRLPRGRGEPARLCALRPGRAGGPGGRFRGRQIMLNFIYTRCPVATMCPAATLRMMAVQKQARAAGVKNLELISITLDPAYDTPGVLKEYAVARGIDTSNFSFLTGPELAIRDLLTQFGVIAEFRDGLAETHPGHAVDRRTGTHRSPGRRQRMVGG